MVRLDKINGYPVSVLVAEDDVKSGNFRELGALATGMTFGDGEVFELNALGTAEGLATPEVPTIVLLAPVTMDKQTDMLNAQYVIANGEVVRGYILERGDIFTIDADIAVPDTVKEIGTENIMGIACKVYRVI